MRAKASIDAAEENAMRRGDLILDGTAFAVPRSIQEDDLPRNGGPCPEYAHTLILCMDSFDQGLAAGRLYSFCLSDPCEFHSLDQLLFTLVDLLDKSGLAEAWYQARSLIHKNKPHGEWMISRKVQKAPPVSAFHELRPPRGLLATFYLRVYSRQHTSLQGVLAQAEKNYQPVCFRSALELIGMLKETLETSNHNMKYTRTKTKIEKIRSFG